MKNSEIAWTDHSFKDESDGGGPSAGLLQDTQGNLYGTTVAGGNISDCGGYGCGVVFKLSKSGKFSVLHTFTGGADGSNPASTLVQDAQGNLNGTTTAGGAYSSGVVFKLSKAAKLTALHTFTGGADGGVPDQGVVLDEQSNLYGTTFQGGDLSACSAGCGVVYKVTKAGEETVLYGFKGGPDGSSPAFAALVRDKLGNLYGTTEYGGNQSACNGGCGTVFELSKAGKETVLYKFNENDGAYPSSGLLRGSEDDLYGYTSGGGTSQNCGEGGCGVVPSREGRMGCSPSEV